jgi:hypothetical protein
MISKTEAQVTRDGTVFRVVCIRQGGDFGKPERRP